MEVVGRSPLVVLDCAHNTASAETVVQTLRESFPPGRRLLIFAGSNDKDLAGMFRILGPHFAHVFLTPYLGSPQRPAGTAGGPAARGGRSAGHTMRVAGVGVGGGAGACAAGRPDLCDGVGVPGGRDAAAADGGNGKTEVLRASGAKIRVFR